MSSAKISSTGGALRRLRQITYCGDASRASFSTGTEARTVSVSTCLPIDTSPAWRRFLVATSRSS
nr:hypothetical protein [Chroococcidiopsis sp. SAG 2025]